MPGKDRLREIVTESIRDAETGIDIIRVISRHLEGSYMHVLDDAERKAHEGITRAAETARILVRGGE